MKIYFIGNVNTWFLILSKIPSVENCWKTLSISPSIVWNVAPMLVISNLLESFIQPAERERKKLDTIDPEVGNCLNIVTLSELHCRCSIVIRYSHGHTNYELQFMRINKTQTCSKDVAMRCWMSTFSCSCLDLAVQRFLNLFILSHESTWNFSCTSRTNSKLCFLLTWYYQ